MGPRSFNRGKNVSNSHTANFFRSFNGAAVFQPRKGDRRDLQHLISHICFNGAAVFQPRKGVSVYEEDDEGLCFNGAAVFQPRKEDGQREVVTMANRFNGAAVFQPRKGLPIRRPQPPLPRSFNGAAVFQPRKARRRKPNGRQWRIRRLREARGFIARIRFLQFRVVKDQCLITSCGQRAAAGILKAPCRSRHQTAKKTSSLRRFRLNAS